MIFDFPTSLSRFPINRSKAQFILWPSLLCLDAPLVAVVWALVVDSLNDGSSVSVYPILALFSAVWAIYLFDRLYDTRNFAIEKNTPQRHRFTARFRVLIFVLLFVSLTLAAISFPSLPRPVVQGGVILTVVTVAYYIAFRFLRIFSDPLTTGPWKELTIALCFTAGIFLSVTPMQLSATALCLSLAMTALFLSNCLRISLAEADYDRSNDTAGFFASSSRRSSKAITLLPSVALILSLYLILQGRVIPVGLSILIASIASLAINRSQRIPNHLVQALADLSLLIPPLVVLGIEFLLPR